MKYLSSSMDTFNVQKTKAIDKIRFTRKSIDDFLNKIEQEFLDDLETKHSKLNSKMDTLLQQLEQRTNEISQLQNGFSSMTKFASDLNMYFGLKEIEKITSETETYIEDLKNRETFDEKNLEVTISSSLQSIVRDVKSFGNIHINSSQSTLRIKTGRKAQAQNLSPICPGIEEIKPTMLITLTIPDDMKSKLKIRACRILPDGKYLILDFQDESRLLLFSKMGMFIRIVMTFTQRAFDACLVRNKTVAVTLGLANKIALVDIKKNKISQEVKFSHVCSTVSSDGLIMVISGGSYTSTIVNLKDMSRTYLQGVVTDNVALFSANIYGIISKQVCCFTNSGERLWTFIPHDNIRPMAITLDGKGCVYVSFRENNSIVIVSPDGKNSKPILSEAGGIKFPSAIDFNREMGMLIVSSKTSDQFKAFETTFVYKI